VLGDRDVAVVVGAQQRHGEHSHLVQQTRRRMAVVVVQADAHHRDPRVCRREEVRVEVRRAVVRHLQDIGAQGCAGGEDRGLLGWRGVAGEQDADAVHGSAHDQ
jgi:hypothetical protein